MWQNWTRDDTCPSHPPSTQFVPEINPSSAPPTKGELQDINTTVPNLRPETVENFGSWMLVKKPQRKKNSKQATAIAGSKNGESGPDPTRPEKPMRPGANQTRDLKKEIAITKES